LIFSLFSCNDKRYYKRSQSKAACLPFLLFEIFFFDL